LGSRQGCLVALLPSRCRCFTSNMAALFRSQAGGSSLCPHTTALCLRRIFRHVRLFPGRHVHDELGKQVGVARAFGSVGHGMKIVPARAGRKPCLTLDGTFSFQTDPLPAEAHAAGNSSEACYPARGVSAILEARHPAIVRNPRTENAARKAADPVRSERDDGVWMRDSWGG